VWELASGAQGGGGAPPPAGQKRCGGGRPGRAAHQVDLTNSQPVDLTDNEEDAEDYLAVEGPTLRAAGATILRPITQRS
jgi:hypothetical protein